MRTTPYGASAFLDEHLCLCAARRETARRGGADPPTRRPTCVAADPREDQTSCPLGVVGRVLQTALADSLIATVPHPSPMRSTAATSMLVSGPPVPLSRSPAPIFGANSTPTPAKPRTAPGPTATSRTRGRKRARRGARSRTERHDKNYGPQALLSKNLRARAPYTGGVAGEGFEPS